MPWILDKPQCIAGSHDRWEFPSLYLRPLTSQSRTTAQKAVNVWLLVLCTATVKETSDRGFHNSCLRSWLNLWHLRAWQIIAVYLSRSLWDVATILVHWSIKPLTHHDRNKMVPMLQTTFSRAFTSRKCLTWIQISLKFLPKSLI